MAKRAFKYLQDALTEAASHVSGSGNTAEVWVAAGTYKPTEFASGFPPCSGRACTFNMMDHVGIYGGFAGNEGPNDFNLRNPATNITILSGDIGTADDWSDNSYHVVTAADLRETALIDGFHIIRGMANNSTSPGGCAPAGAGGGLVIYQAVASQFLAVKPVVLRCLFKENRAVHGGAVLCYIFKGDPRFWNCHFLQNSAEESEGATGNGGAVYVDQRPQQCSEDEGPTIASVTPQFLNCLFWQNESRDHGGAVYSGQLAIPNLTNCTIVENVAGTASGGSSIGGGVYHDSTGSGICAGGTGTAIHNCIIWDNESDTTSNAEEKQIAGRREVTHSCIQDLTSSSCHADSTDIEPQFSGFFEIAFDECANSHVVNTGDNTKVEDDIYDLNQNTSNSDKTPDLLLLPRVVGTNVDMGCYELQGPPCIGDVTNDGIVNVNDLLAVLNNWGACANCACPIDFWPLPFGDGTINVNDLLQVINRWGANCMTGQTMNVGSLTSVQDCMDFATYEMELTPHSQEWNDAVNRCVAGLCEAKIINCD